jgi:hypothetical protein
MNNIILLSYLLLSAVCLVCFFYTPLSEGWRTTHGQRLVFTPPLLQRLVGISLVLAGPSCLLIAQTSDMVGCAAFLFALLAIPGLFAGFGTQEFTADLATKTYFTRRGFLGITQKKTGQLSELRGVQIREVPGFATFIYIMRPGDKEKGGFQTGYSVSRSRATAAAQQVSTELQIPLIPPKTYKQSSGF